MTKILERASKQLIHSEFSKFLSLASKVVKTGVKIRMLHPNRGWQCFTIRDDYDFDRGERPFGKGCHVKMELPDVEIAYCSTGCSGRLSRRE